MSNHQPQSWTAERYLGRAEFGRTFPLRLACSRQSDNARDSAEFFAKFVGLPEVIEQSLFAEMLGNVLARACGIMTGEPAFIEIDEPFSELLRHVDVRVKPGVGVGSRSLGSGIGPPTFGRMSDEQMQDAARIYLFDLLVQNPDRRADNPNCVVVARQLVAIDFESCFSFLYPIVGNSAHPWEVSRHGIGSRHLFHGQLKGQSMKWSLMVRNMMVSAWEVLASCEAWMPHASEKLEGTHRQSLRDSPKARARVDFRSHTESYMKVAYTFSLVRYVHDPIAGEALNVGVLLFSPSISFLDVRLEYRFERFSAAFARFDGERFKQVLRHFAGAVDEAREELTSAQLFIADSGHSSTAAEIGRRIWTDLGTSFRVSDPMGGVGDDLPAILDDLFDRFVTSQYERQQPDHLSDDQVWSLYRSKLSNIVTRNLRQKTFQTPDYTIQFDHAFQNERWHLLQPVSMDYAKATLMQDKAAKWLGAAMNLQESIEAAKGKFYFLLHPPESQKHHDAYIRSKNILHKIPLDHEIFEEDEAGALSEELLAHIQHESR